MKGVQQQVTVTHGPWVETQEQWFVEGVWDGPYEHGAFDSSLSLMGSGGKLAGERIVFAAPCHTLDRLYVTRRRTSLFVANSLPFLLAQAGLTLDPKYPHYKRDLWSLVQGFERCVKSLPTREGIPVQLFYCCNIHVGPDLEMHVTAKAAPSDWSSFAEYRAFLRGTLGALYHNGSSPQRSVAYDWLASISSGYDSAAAAALIADLGCRRGVTFGRGNQYRSDGRDADDSGAAIGQLLGLTVKEFSNGDYRKADPEVIAEFAAGGDTLDLQLAALEEELPRKLLVTGYGGDTFWNPLNPTTSSSMARGFPPNGAGFIEFRLRIGFIHIPVPYLGAVRHPCLHAISNSAEMKDWTLGNDYDRPIPRRILEEKGVPRALFGQSKKGAFAAVQYGRKRIRRMTALEDYYQCNRRRRSLWSRAWAELYCFAGRAMARWTRISRKYGLPLFFPEKESWDYPSPGRPSYVVPWGNTELMQRYLAPNIVKEPSVVENH